ncbi:MAG: RHS repeat-associated core domain-containing protein [Gemmataceae bacterium]
MSVPTVYSRFARILALRDRLAALFAGRQTRKGSRLTAETLEDRIVPFKSFSALPVFALAPVVGAPASVSGASAVATAGPGDLLPSGFSAYPVRFADGVASVFGVDLASDGFGASWTQARSWSNGAGYSIASRSGSGWVSSAQPQLFQDTTTGYLILVTDATNAAFYQGQGTPDTNGNYPSYTPELTDLQTVTYDATNDEFVFDDGQGGSMRFYGFGSAYPAAQLGTLKSITDPGGNVTAVTSHDSAGRITEVQRAVTVGGVTNTESYVSAYLGSSDPNNGLLDTVTLRRKVGSGSWATVRAVTYTYYDGTTGNGNVGDLERATVTDGSAVLGVSYYRYYTSSSSTGYQHGMRYEFGPQAYARLKAAVGGTDAAVDAASNSALSPYADHYFEYDSSQRVTLEAVAGAGASSAGGLGTYTYAYTASSNTPGFNSWAMKTVATDPAGTTTTVYTNSYAQVMLTAVLPAGATAPWVTFNRYDPGTGPADGGRLVLAAGPSAVTGYSDTYADLVHYVSGNAVYLSDTAGLVSVYSYASSTTATATTGGDVAGYATAAAIRQGETGTDVPQGAWTYYHRSAGGATITLTATETTYRNDNGTGGRTVTNAVTWYSGQTQPEVITTTLPVVSTGQNGSGASTSTMVAYDTFGRPVWSKDAGGFLTYAEYDPVTGAVVKTIADVDDAQTTTFAGLPSGWATPAGGGLHQTTAYETDSLGRATKVTHPGGRVDYVVYLDAAHEVRSYPAWDTTANAPTGPTTVVRADWAAGYVETLTMAATPAVSSGRPTGGESVGSLLSLARAYTNAGGQVTAADAYFDLTGLTYSTSTTLGTSGTHFYRIVTGYDALGRADRTETATGTVYRTVYDGLGGPVGDWVGTDDTPTSGNWSPGNTSGTNLTLVREYEYDGGGVGNGTLTTVTEHPGLSQPDRVTRTWYDWRDRPVAVKAGVETTEATGVNRPLVVTTYDNLGAATLTQTYDGDGVTPSISGGVLSLPSGTAAKLRAQASADYDELGRVYRTDTYQVDPTTGSVGTYTLHTAIFYDARGLVLKTAAPGGLVTKTTYDGLGRPVVTYSADGGGDSSYADVDDVAGDNVFEQVEPTYDAAGRVTRVTTRQRHHDESGYGDLTGLAARVYYAGVYYDLADRPIASVDIGTSPAGAYTWPSTPPASTAAVLVSLTSYDAAGRVYETTDPLGRVTRTTYDALGRVAKTVENYVNGTVSDADDKTTEYTYNAAGMTSLTARLTGGGVETTEWVYGVTTGGGSGLTSNDLVGATQWPDATTGAASSSEQESVTVNALGEAVTATDRNGTTHTLTRDVLGRVTADVVTTLGSGVDGAVRRIETAYDGQGNAFLVTSYDAASGGSVVNQVEGEYNGLGQLLTEWQEHAGAVSVSTTPAVGYTYVGAATGENRSFRKFLTYPSGQQLQYRSDAIGRVEWLSVGNKEEGYEYLGRGTVVIRNRFNGTSLTYVKQGTEPDGEGGDQYAGLDRFGRVVDQRWIDSTRTDLDRLQYGYDRAGNRVFRDSLTDATFGEVYAYDGLDQLASFARGTLNGTRTAVTGTPTRTQDWDYDAVGNWDGIDVDGVTESRTANRQNEYTAVGSLTTPTYDANGNMTRAESGLRYVYDAWNRLVAVRNSAGTTTLEAFGYDGLGRRVKSDDGTTVTDLYYSDRWQVVEEQVGGDTVSRYVWSPLYVDGLVLRDRDTDADGVVDERLWVLQDANWNVTALVDDTGAVVERYVYDPFGQATVYDASYKVQSGSAYDWVYLHQGLRWDATAGLYDNRHRWYSPTLGRFTSLDPIRYDAGDQNLYRYVGNGPTTNLDPSGLMMPPRLRLVNGHMVVTAQDRQDWEELRARSRQRTPTPVPTDYLKAFSDGAAGYADALTFGGTRHVRQGIGYNDAVDMNGTAYAVGQVGGTVHAMALAPASACGNAARMGTALQGLNAVQAGGALANGVQNIQQKNYSGATLDFVGSLASFMSLLRACFAAGTPIRTPDGWMPVEVVRAGDEVLARPDDDPLGDVRPRVVEEVFATVAPVLDLRVCGRTITTTGEHPFYAEGRGWVPAELLAPGDRVLGEAGEWLLVEGVDDRGAVVPVYNFRVAGDHTYFVGETGWGFAAWAHNALCLPNHGQPGHGRPAHGGRQHNATMSNVAANPPLPAGVVAVETRTNQAMLDPANPSGPALSPLRPDVQVLGSDSKLYLYEVNVSGPQNYHLLREQQLRQAAGGVFGQYFPF